MYPIYFNSALLQDFFNDYPPASLHFLQKSEKCAIFYAI